MTTPRGEDPDRGTEDETWFARPRQAPDDAEQTLPVAPGTTRAERRRLREAAEAAAGRPFTDAFTESPSGTWSRPTIPSDATDPPWPSPRPAPDTEPTRADAGAHRSQALADGAHAAGVESGGGRSREAGSAADGGGSGGVGAAGRFFSRAAENGSAGSAADGADGAGPAWRGDGTEGDGVRGAFDPGNTGTWRVRDVVPGADGGRRTTVILRYLLGLLAIDHVRALGRWAFPLPIVGLLLLLVRPRWIGIVVIALGVLLIVARIVAVRLISSRTLPRRYRPVEDELRAAVEAGKANLRGELRRVGMPNSALALPGSVVRLGSSDSRSTARSRLRDIEIDRVLPRAQLDRALRVLDGAPAPR